jgi:hypothetical protein
MLSPNDVVVDGMSKALETLETYHQLNYSRGPADVTQWTSENKSSPSETNPTEMERESQHLSHSGQGLGLGTQDHSHGLRAGRADDDGDAHEDDGRGTDRAGTTHLRRRRSRNEKRLLACPILKHCQLFDLHPSCMFKGAPNMSDVTQHLRTRNHLQTVPFISLCRHCYVYVTSQEEYQSYHKENQYRHGSQRRGARVVENWESLYRKLYPSCNKIPSACKF